MKEKKPDIVCQLNEKWRKMSEDDENQRKKKEEAEKKQKLHYNPVNDEYFWTGPAEDMPLWLLPDQAEFDDAGFCYTLTEEEQELIDKKVEKDFELYIKERKKEEKEERKIKYNEKKKAQNIPLEPLPVRPLCEYEKIRENNNREREAAMTAAGFYSDLLEFKKSCGN